MKVILKIYHMAFGCAEDAQKANSLSNSNFEPETQLMINELENHVDELSHNKVDILDLPHEVSDTSKESQNETNYHSDATSDYSSEDNLSIEGSGNDIDHAGEDHEKAWRDFDWSSTCQTHKKRAIDSKVYSNSYTISSINNFKSLSPKKILSYNSRRIYNLNGNFSGDLKIKKDEKSYQILSGSVKPFQEEKTKLSVNTSLSIIEQNGSISQEDEDRLPSPVSSLDSFDTFDTFPDKMLVRVKSIEFNPPRPYDSKTRTSIRLVIHSVTHHTKPSTSIEELLQTIICFPFDYHSYVFDTLKLDVYDYGSFLYTKKRLGRTNIRLNTFKQAIINQKEFEGKFPLEAYGYSNTREVGSIVLNIKFHFPNLTPTKSQPLNVHPKAILDRDIFSGKTPSKDVPINFGDLNELENANANELENAFAVSYPEPKLLGILDLVLSKETREAIKEITVLYHAFFDNGWRLTKLEFLKAYMLLEKYYLQKSNPVTGNLVYDVEKIQTAQRYLKYSMASYGSFLFNWFGYGHNMAPLNAIRMNSDRKAVQEFFGLEKNDIICWEYGLNTVSVPNYMVIRDPETNAIIISIRGTMNVADVITDALAHYERWNGGFVHRGMFRSAQYLVNRSLTEIKAAVNKFNSNSIRVIGHSLGASISALVTILLHEQCKDLLEQGVDIRAWNFATAPCCSLDIACTAEALGCIDNFINENDIIPRLSYGNLMDFKELVKFAASELKNENYKKLNSKERFAKIMSSIDAYRTSLKSKSSRHKLYIPGTIYYLYKGHVKSPFLDFYTKDIVCEKSKPHLFTDLSLRRNWLFHHFPDRYDKKFKYVLKFLLRKSNEDGVDKIKSWKKWKKFEEHVPIGEEGGRIERWMSKGGHI
ncbi:hypothetical protein Glove_359g13 [Diversispora epigaea]|uniref:sn-1-specific diacylglycerol lipase n=1 Tax=Diversispora epigaea TaxID=1348612 RepID=A0A397HEU3_9GLOM|nr:hypothetical protein Glove_359g13 [Diversispora epigaea]